MVYFWILIIPPFLYNLPTRLAHWALSSRPVTQLGVDTRASRTKSPLSKQRQYKKPNRHADCTCRNPWRPNFQVSLSYASRLLATYNLMDLFTYLFTNYIHTYLLTYFGFSRQGFFCVILAVLEFTM